VLRGDAPAVIEYAQRALAVMPETPTFDRTNVYVRLGVGYGMAGRLADSLHAYEQARVVGIASSTPAAALMPLPNMVMLYMLLGQLRNAQAAAQQGVQLGQSHPALAGTLGIIHNRLSELHYEQNDLAQAQADLERGLELFSSRGEVDNYGLWRSWLAYIREARSDRAGAQQAQQQARQIVDKFSPGGDFYDSAQGYQAWFDLRWGQPTRALDWAHAYLHTRSHPVDYNDSFAAIILLENGEPQLAADFLTKVIAEAEASHNQGDLIKALARRAIAWRALRQPDRAFADLQRAIDLAAPEGYMRSILDAGEAIKLLVADFRLWIEKQSVAREEKQRVIGYTDRLVTALAPATYAAAASISNQQHLHRAAAQRAVQVSTLNNLVEPLSDRELDVLRLLAEGLTNQEIGQKLYISLPTVKTHTANIYGKLGVNSRRDAVAHARTIGLLPS
jgi:LuxR family maltose regulon positive regulatory protein